MGPHPMSCPAGGRRRARRQCPGSLLPLVTLLLCTLLCAPNSATAASTEYIEDSEHFPGWKGALPAATGVDDANTRHMSVGSLGKIEWAGQVQHLSWKPRAFLYQKFLSDEECDHLMTKGAANLVPSEVIDSETGKAKNDSVRTSSGFYYDVGEDEIVKRIERRLSYITSLPVENGEGMQILRYVNGQKYDPHHDFFWDTINNRPETGGQRAATVLMYLTTPEEGGETVFPQGLPKSEGPDWSACAREGLSVKAVRGNAVLFLSLLPNGTTDTKSEHGSCPTLKGTKFSATKWIHVARIGPEVDPGGCVNLEPECNKWAASGECQKNAKYMLKGCRKSCNSCPPPPAEGNEEQQELLGADIETVAESSVGVQATAKDE